MIIFTQGSRLCTVPPRATKVNISDWLIEIFSIFDAEEEEEEGLYPQSLSGYLVEVAECQVEVWEISSGVVASCGEPTTAWVRGEDRARTTLVREFLLTFNKYDKNNVLAS